MVTTERRAHEIKITVIFFWQRGMTLQLKKGGPGSRSLYQCYYPPSRIDYCAETLVEVQRFNDFPQDDNECDAPGWEQRHWTPVKNRTPA